MVIDGVMLLWFILTALSVLFVAIDIRTVRRQRSWNRLRHLRKGAFLAHRHP